jgi:hypothetical protein
MDERLRALERAARSNPGDLTAVWAFVRALEHSGDTFAAWSEKCRLARVGDDLAWRELSPAPRGARRLTLGATRTFVERVRGVTTSGRDVLLINQDSEIHCLDARSLARRWSAPTSSNDAGAICGSTLVHAGPDSGATLHVRDLVDGTEHDTLPLPEGNRAWSVTGVADRAVACCSAEVEVPDALVVVDLTRTGGPPPPVRRFSPRPIVVRDVSLHANLPDRLMTTARDLTSGDVRWTAPGQPLHADAHAAFLLTSAGRSMQIDCVVVATGSTSWRHLVSVDDTVSHAIGPELLVVATTPPPWAKTGRERLDIDAVERGTGEVRWSYEEEVGLHAVAALAVTNEIVYVVHGPFVDPALAQRARPQTLLALDARTGERVDSVTIPELPALAVSMFPVERAVVVFLWGRQRSAWVGRFGED